MSDCDSSCQTHQKKSKNEHVCEGSEGVGVPVKLSDDDVPIKSAPETLPMSDGSDNGGRKLMRREKNRVAAQKSRKRQTQRADVLHEACELLEQRNRKLKREVDSLSEELRQLTEALRAHEPFCPIMHCCFAAASSASSTLQPDSRTARSV